MGLFKKNLTEEKNVRLEEERTKLLEQIEEEQANARNLKNEVKQLKLDKKIEEENIKHMIKMKEERMQLDFEKKKAALERTKEEEIARVKDTYRDKVEQGLNKRGDEMQNIMVQILNRLPNVTAKLKGNLNALEHKD